MHPTLHSIALACLLAATPSGLSGQGLTHLNVPAKQMVVIQHNEFFDSTTGIATTAWFEYILGNKIEVDPRGYTVPAGRNLIITDLDISLHCEANTTQAPMMSFTVYDRSGTPIHDMVRFIPNRTTVGNEQQKISLTSGVAIPEGYRISVTNVPWGNYTIRRATLMGYFVD